MKLSKCARLRPSEDMVSVALDLLDFKVLLVCHVALSIAYSPNELFCFADVRMNLECDIAHFLAGTESSNL